MSSPCLRKRPRAALTTVFFTLERELEELRRCELELEELELETLLLSPERLLELARPRAGLRLRLRLRLRRLLLLLLRLSICLPGY